MNEARKGSKRKRGESSGIYIRPQQENRKENNGGPGTGEVTIIPNTHPSMNENIKARWIQDRGRAGASLKSQFRVPFG